MKLTDLIDYLRNPEKLTQLYIDQEINIESEAILICMESCLDLDSDIKCFGIEQTDDYIAYRDKGIDYVQLFPVGMAVELVNDFQLVYKGSSDLFIAQRLLDYRINDA